jgi:protein TonB
MELSAWTGEDVDAVRLKRLGVGYLVGIVGLAGVVSFFALTASGEEPAGDEGIDVELATLPQAEEPEPEPESEPEPEPVQPEPAPARHSGPRLQALEAPTEVPDDAPAEADGGAVGSDGGGDPYANGSGDGSGRVDSGRAATPPPPPPAPPPPPPKKKKAIRVTEDVTPPVALAQAMPSYPEAAKSAGIEGTVVVSYVVTETGDVAAVSAVRGPAELRAACEAVVRTWRFKPAELDGKPVAVRRTARFPFRIKT